MSYLGLCIKQNVATRYNVQLGIMILIKNLEEEEDEEAQNSRNVDVI